MPAKLIFFSFCLLVLLQNVAGQNYMLKKDTIYSDQLADKMIHHMINSRIISVATLPEQANLVYFKRDSCDKLVAYYFKTTSPVNGFGTHGDVLLPPTQRRGVHGDVLYTLDYRSYVDTPYAQPDVYQHTLQSNLTFYFRNQYPLNVYITTRFGNALISRSFTDLNFGFDRQQFSRNVKEQIREYVIRTAKAGAADSIKQLLTTRQFQLLQLQGWLTRPSTLQLMVEERERSALKRGMPDADTFSNRSPQLKVDTGITITNALIAEEYAHKLHLRDSLQREVAKLEGLYKKTSKTQVKQSKELELALTNANSYPEMLRVLKAYQIPNSVLPKGYRFVSSIRSLGIGRVFLNFN